MAYCTEDLVRKSVGNLKVTVISDADILEIIEEATSRIDSFIGIKYTLPLALPVPKLIQRICRDISACHVYEDVIARGVAVSDGPKIKSRCERAEETLEALRDGEQRLILDDGKTATENSGAASKPWSSTDNYNPFFNTDDPTDWKFSELEISDVADSRDD